MSLSSEGTGRLTSMFMASPDPARGRAARTPPGPHGPAPCEMCETAFAAFSSTRLALAKTPSCKKRSCAASPVEAWPRCGLELHRHTPCTPANVHVPAKEPSHLDFIHIRLALACVSPAPAAPAQELPPACIWLCTCPHQPSTWPHQPSTCPHQPGTCPHQPSPAAALYLPAAALHLPPSPRPAPPH